MSDSVPPRRWQPTRLLCPWDSPGKNSGVGCRFLLQCMKMKSESEMAQSCPTLSNPMDCRLPGSSVHGIFQARVLEWVSIAFSDIYISYTNTGTSNFSSLILIPIVFASLFLQSRVYIPCPVSFPVLCASYMENRCEIIFKH